MTEEPRTNPDNRDHGLTSGAITFLTYIAAFFGSLYAYTAIGTGSIVFNPLVAFIVFLLSGYILLPIIFASLGLFLARSLIPDWQKHRRFTGVCVSIIGSIGCALLVLLLNRVLA